MDFLLTKYISINDSFFSYTFVNSLSLSITTQVSKIENYYSFVETLSAPSHSLAPIRNQNKYSPRNLSSSLNKIARQ